MNKTHTFLKVSGGVLGLVSLLAILVAGNALIGKFRVRADLTGEKIYTLSEGTRAVLKKIDQPVTLKLFFSRSIPEMPPQIKAYATEVEDLLKEYAMAADGKVIIEKYDPQPDSDSEEWAQRYGITGQPLDMFGPPVYLGLVAVMGDQEATIPALDPQGEALLEYNLTRLIHRVGHPEKPVLGILGTLPVMGRRAPPFAMPGQPRQPNIPPWVAFQDLAEDYQIRDLAPTTDRIDDDIKSLVVVHPKDLSDSTLYAIDQFVLRGGRLLVFVDPMCVTDIEASGGASPFGMPKCSSDLKPLFLAWGVDYNPMMVVGDLRAASRIRTGEDRVEESPVWLSFRSANMNRKDILTGQLDSIMVPFAGALSAQSTKELTVAPLITTSENAALVDVTTAQYGGSALRGAFKKTGTPINIALRLSGHFKTAFPAGKPKEQPKPNEAKPEEKPAPDAPALAEGDSTVIIVADVDMLYDRYCVQAMNFLGTSGFQPLNNNITFFANGVEQVAGSTDLVGIRSRGRFARPFDRVLALQETAMTAWQAKEKELEEQLKQTQERIKELQTSKKDKSQRFILSDQQKQAVQSFQETEIAIKRDLKEVRKSLRSDIEDLGLKVKLVNIALMPLVVVCIGIGFGMYRRGLKRAGRKENA